MVKSILISIILSIFLVTSPLTFSQEVFAGTPSQREEYKCYGVTGMGPTEPVSLRDQFGDMEDVTVNGLTEFCASATKVYKSDTFESPHGFGNHLNCYEIKKIDPTTGNLMDLPIPIDPVTGEQFVVDLGGMGQFDDEIDVEIGIPKKLCNPASKFNPPGGTEEVPVDLTHYKCYEITGSQVLEIANLRDQFLPDGEDHIVFEPIYFCNPVIKIMESTILPGTSEAPSGPHLKCYNIDKGDIDTSPSVSSIDQFEISHMFNLPHPNTVCSEVTKNIKRDKMAVGGEIIPLDTTIILLAGTHSVAAWMIPIIVSAIGIGIVIARKF